jgi:5-histidylcysteine sulfoxide synthase
MDQYSLYPITLDGDDTDKKREEIREYFRNTYDIFENIFEVLKDDKVFYRKSEPTRHPMIFYFGHTASFFINKLFIMGVIDKRINANFESIFAIGVDEMHWDDLDNKNYQWPKVQEVREYRDRVRELVDGLITTLPLNLPIKQDDPFWIILMGIEHERIHIETSLVLHAQMPIEFIKETDRFNISTNIKQSVDNSMVDIASKNIKLGKDKNHNLYGWDNEYGDFTKEVEKFKASKYLVSNAEYMEFVKDGGYEKLEYWDDEGKKYLDIKKAKYPVFWIKDKDQFKYRTLCKEIDLPLNWPVEVNALEAMAFCRYKSKKDGLEYRLPSEVEYRSIYEDVGLKDILDFDAKDANQNFEHYFSSTSTDEFGFKTSNGQKIYDVVGNVWQWSRTPIFGFDGFEVHPAYDDFSTPTFDDKHALILGSSWASSGNLVMKHSRYAFRRHFPQFAGFRYVLSDAKEITKKTNAIKDAEVLKYYKFQYHESEFSKKCVQIASKYAKEKNKALDLGCACGRCSFELSKIFDSVQGVDFSARFINVGVDLLRDGYIEYENHHVTLQNLGYKLLQDKVEFWQGDANNLKPNFNSYDFIMVTNLEDRFYEAKRFLDDVSNRLNDSGILVLIFPKDRYISDINGFKSIDRKELSYVMQNKDYEVDLSVWEKI